MAICNEDCFNCRYPDCIRGAAGSAKLEARRRYAERNRERLREYSRKYYREHREEYARRRHEFYQHNKERVAAYAQRTYERYAANPAVAEKGRRLRDVRKNLKLSQASVADICGKSAMTISLYERGRLNCPEALIEKLEGILSAEKEMSHE